MSTACFYSRGWTQSPRKSCNHSSSGLGGGIAWDEHKKENCLSSDHHNHQIKHLCFFISQSLKTLFFIFRFSISSAAVFFRTKTRSLLYFHSLFFLHSLSALALFINCTKVYLKENRYSLERWIDWIDRQSTCLVFTQFSNIFQGSKLWCGKSSIHPSIGQYENNNHVFLLSAQKNILCKPQNLKFVFSQASLNTQEN